MYVSAYPYSEEYCLSKVVYLDTQPVLNSQGYFEELCRKARNPFQTRIERQRKNEKIDAECICRHSMLCKKCHDGKISYKKAKAEFALRRNEGILRRAMESLALCMWTISVCDVVIVCNGQSFYETEILKLIRTSRQLLCKIPGSGLFCGSSADQTLISCVGCYGRLY